MQARSRVQAAPERRRRAAWAESSSASDKAREWMPPAETSSKPAGRIERGRILRPRCSADWPAAPDRHSIHRLEIAVLGGHVTVGVIT